MRRTTTLTAAGLVGLALLTPTSAATAATAATAAAETCRGEAATIVGSTPTLTGTEGRDVIVTGTASQVAGLGGDDLICVTGGGSSNLATIDAGSGDDTVDTSGLRSYFYVTVHLGAGADTFVGGPGDDTVTTGPTDAQGIDADRDVVRTGGGMDTVTTGSPAGTNSDVVDTGADDDRVTLVTWRTASDGLVTGGDGTDRLITTTAPVEHEVSVDMAAGALTGIPSSPLVLDEEALFSSFEGLSLEVTGEEVTYRGTEGDDYLELSVEDGCCVASSLRADTFGGDDLLLLHEATLEGPGRIDLGAGSDQLVAARTTGRLGLDLKRAELTSPDGTLEALGIEDALLMAPRVDLVGDNRANRLTFNGCRATISGGHGNDHLGNVNGDAWWEEFDYDCTARSTVRGGPGKDSLTGGMGRDRLFGDGDRDQLSGRSGNDVLVGGRGRDTADGGKGRDRCVAEREKSCER